MTANTGDLSAREQRVNVVIASYLQAADTGQAPDRAEFLARHADIAAELDAFFADRDRFRRVARPLANDAPTVAPGEPSGVSRGLTAPGDTVRYFGDYELLEEIARGGMGVVFKARQVSLDRTVALKMILAGQLASAADVQRFHAEAKAAANLKHPNIVAIHEVGQHDGQHFFSMDYIAGKSLAELIRANPLPAERAARYVRAIAEAIHYAHQQGTLHRDIKPSNVLIDTADRPHVTDFGLAKRLRGDAGLTMTGQVLGTPSYMPPEQAAGRPEQVGAASDVYSLGAMLYELLTGRPPFRAESVFDTIMQVVNTEPVPPRLLNPKVPRELDTICVKCLEKDPRKRFAGAQELADDLGRYLTGEPIQARPPSVPFVVRHWFRQNLRATAWTIGIGLAAGLIMSALCLYHWVTVAEEVRDAYAVLPNVRPPWVAPAPETMPPVWLGLIAFVLMLAAFVGQGLVAALVVRPANTAADVAVGAATGVVAGLTFFILGLGPLFNGLYGFEPSNRDLYALTHVAGFPPIGPPNAPDQVTQNYPDLAGFDRYPRCEALRAKIRADLKANGTKALWVAMALSLMPVPLGVMMSMLGGRMVRRGDQPIMRTFWDYNPTFALLGIAMHFALALLLWLPVALGFYPPDTPWWFMLSSLPFVIAWSLHRRHRKLYQEPIWRGRHLLAVLLLLTSIVSLARFIAESIAFLDECTQHALVQIPLWPWYVDALVYVVMLVLVVCYLVQQRTQTVRAS
jgi:predicted Ser/Thr protein kinase